MDRLRRSILSGRAMIAFQVSRRRRSTYQRNKAIKPTPRGFAASASLRSVGGGLLHAPLALEFESMN